MAKTSFGPFRQLQGIWKLLRPGCRDRNLLESWKSSLSSDEAAWCSDALLVRQSHADRVHELYRVHALPEC